MYAKPFANSHATMRAIKVIFPGQEFVLDKAGGGGHNTLFPGEPTDGGKDRALCSITGNGSPEFRL